MSEETKTILIADKVDPAVIEQLTEQYGAENIHVRLHGDIADPKSPEKSHATAGDIMRLKPDVVVVRSTNLNSNMAVAALESLQKAGKETLFVRGGAGVENLAKAQGMGFIVENTDGANRTGVRDLQLAGIGATVLNDLIENVTVPETGPTTSLEVFKLAVERHNVLGGGHPKNDIPEVLTEKHREILKNDPIDRLQGEVAFVSGSSGNIGSEMVQLFKDLGMQPAASAARMSEAKAQERGLKLYPNMAEAAREALIISDNVPVQRNGPTKGGIKQAVFDNMRDDAAMLLTSRARRLDIGITTDRMLFIDDSPKAFEKTSEDPALELTAPNAINSMKSGSKTVESTKRVGTMVLDQIIAYLDEGEYKNVTNLKDKALVEKMLNVIADQSPMIRTLAPVDPQMAILQEQEMRDTVKDSARKQTESNPTAFIRKFLDAAEAERENPTPRVSI